MDSLWHTSNAWPTVRTIRIAWVCNSKRVLRHQDILIHADKETASCSSPDQCRRSSGIQTRFGRQSHGCLENYILQCSCLPENIGTAVHPLASSESFTCWVSSGLNTFSGRYPVELHRNGQEMRFQNIMSFNAIFTGELATVTTMMMMMMMIMMIIIIITIIMKYANKSKIQNLCVCVCNVTLGTAYKCN